MRLLFDIDGASIDAEFSAAPSGAELTIDGRRYSAEVSEPEPGLYVILIGGRVFRCTIDRTPDGSTEVIVNGRRRTIEVRDPKRTGARSGSAAGAGGRAVLTAPMPGKIVRVLRAVGDEIEAEAGLLVVEAMKMQNEVRSPKAGRVAEIRVEEGQTVNAGDVLAIVE
jgi:biotin carboxyl carrier protein